MRAISSTRAAWSSTVTRVRVVARYGFLGNRPLPVGLRRHLGQVGHAQYLSLPPKLSQHAADDLGHAAADTDIHLIEDQRRPDAPTG
jgi:hypothetical protein